MIINNWRLSPNNHMHYNSLLLYFFLECRGRKGAGQWPRVSARTSHFISCRQKLNPLIKLLNVRLLVWPVAIQLQTLYTYSPRSLSRPLAIQLQTLYTCSPRSLSSTVKLLFFIYSLCLVITWALYSLVCTVEQLPC